MSRGRSGGHTEAMRSDLSSLHSKRRVLGGRACSRLLGATLFPCVLIAASAWAPARADDGGEIVPPAVATARNEARLDFGLGSPVGFIGVSYSREIFEWLQGQSANVDGISLEPGVGLGFSGVQVSTLAKLILGGWRHHLLLGIGPSVAFEGEGKQYANEQPPGRIYFLNGEISYEYRTDFHLAFSLGVGTSLVLPGSAHYARAFWNSFPNGVESHRWEPYASLRLSVLGVWF